MSITTSNLTPEKQRLYEQIVDALYALFGAHPGYWPVHAKGLVCEGPLARLRPRLPSAVPPTSKAPRCR